MDRNLLRCVNDKKLFDSLVADPAVKRVNELLERQEKKDPNSAAARKHLLSTSLRVTRPISPELHKISEACVKKLAIDVPIELFVYSDPRFNAACFKPEQNRLYIMFSSSLIEAFTPSEISYVLGHELGHYIYGHHSLPLGLVLREENQVPRSLALNLFRWSRFAEISADRAGAYCAGDFQSVAGALFKLSSGLSGSGIIKLEFKEYIQQVDQLIADYKNSVLTSDFSDWYSTHPFSPLRLKALQFFFKSEIMTSGGLSSSELEQSVENTLSFMEPDYLTGKTKEAKALRDLFVASALLLSHADGQFNEIEKEKFSELLNHELNLDVLDPERIKESLPGRIDKVNEDCSEFQKQQVLRDLLLVASSDELIAPSERSFLNKTCQDLKVDTAFLDFEIKQKLDLD